MFSIDKSVMLLVDVQGQLAQLMYKKEELFNSLEIMIKGMQILGVPIIWMEQIPSKLGPTLESLSSLLPDASPIEKYTFSCCQDSKFVDSFQAHGRSQVLLTGIESHICVYQTGRDLLDGGHQVQVVSDCVSSRTKENKDVGLKRLTQAGAEITSVEMAFFELMKDAKAEAFRQVVKLIK